MDLKVGDVVTLKSGGPCMTVQWVKDQVVHVQWFETMATQRSPDPFTNMGFGSFTGVMYNYGKLREADLLLDMLMLAPTLPKTT